MDLIVVQLPEKLIGSLENKQVAVSSHDLFVEGPHIDFICGDQQWKLEDCIQP